MWLGSLPDDRTEMESEDGNGIDIDMSGVNMSEVRSIGMKRNIVGVSHNFLIIYLPIVRHLMQKIAKLGKV